MSTEIFPDMSVPCCMEGGECVCGSEERILRGYMRQEPGLQPMTAEQRAWCIDEIGKVEGYDDDYSGLPDFDLAQIVMNAWVDYCRDKGML